jgi:hypothetical protein
VGSEANPSIHSPKGRQMSPLFFLNQHLIWQSEEFARYWKAILRIPWMQGVPP